MSRSHAFVGLMAAGLVAGLVVVAVPVVTGSPPGAQRRCRAVTLAVSLAPDRPADQRIAANYCEPTTWAEPRTVDVLADGTTYTGYWDWPDRTYSVVDRLLATGRATLTYDRIGTGRSSRPTDDVTLTTDVHVLDQILTWLQPNQIILFTHSYSAAVGIQLATVPGKVSQLVVTGFLHTSRDPVVARRIQPATRDHPRWRDFAAQQALPADRNPSSAVAVPVVIAVGDRDAIFCAQGNCSDAAAIERFERPFFRSAPSLRVIVAAAGHSLALDPSGPDTAARITAALDAAAVQR
ncbi:alpha/beta fold hydrolase [Virgisporangium aurantiacum]|uniref:alpha/beta fold hydrolase n=1 Tax=Virgisporangium aurantiacum TaxID=175570 RepID=UPI00194FA16C|nr:alpha/beta fold hydrolase [Virgisporangium aurantiacum]